MFKVWQFLNIANRQNYVYLLRNQICWGWCKSCFSLLQITFYEEKNFQGRSYECSTDCNDIHMHLNRCNSCRVDNGCFVVYDRSNFLGNQVFLRRGDYPDLQRIGTMTGMMGIAMMDSIRSCRMIPMVRFHIWWFLLWVFYYLR